MGFKRPLQVWGCSSMVEQLPTMCQALNSAQSPPSPHDLIQHVDFAVLTPLLGWNTVLQVLY